MHTYMIGMLHLYMHAYIFRDIHYFYACIYFDICFAFIHASPCAYVHTALNTKRDYIGQEPYLIFLIITILND